MLALNISKYNYVISIEVGVLVQKIFTFFIKNVDMILFVFIMTKNTNCIINIYIYIYYIYILYTYIHMYVKF